VGSIAPTRISLIQATKTVAPASTSADAIVFTAGIGENSFHMRARIAERLAKFGGALDPDASACF
jgi:acetate kinase